MTMQIGMVGSDGIIIASDMQAVRTGIARTTYKTNKIFCSQESGFAYCCAGSDLAVLAGRKTAELITQEKSLTLVECAERAARNVYRDKYGECNQNEDYNQQGNALGPHLRNLLLPRAS